MSPGVSIIIPTYNGASRISGVLNALQIQSVRPDEVIVVIDGSKDNTRKVVEEFIGKLPIRIVEIPNGGRSVARNTGVKHANHELLVFFDDDMRPFTDCIKDHINHHKNYSGSLLVGHIFEDPALFVTDIQRYRITLFDRKGWTRTNRDFKPMKEDEMYLAAANFSITRSVFDSLKGFDETLTDSEDYDLGARALKLGLNIYALSKGADAYHDDLITCRTYINRQRQYIISVQNLARKKPELYARFLDRKGVRIPAIRKPVYFLISNRFVVKLIDAGFFKYLLPEKIRYRFYDMVIGGMVDVFPDRKTA